MKRRFQCLWLTVCFLWVSVLPGYAVSGVTDFQDVSPKSPFYQAIDWAVRKGITNGTTSVTFSPAQTCNRQQILTFLWRYMGSPPIDWNVFDDVPENNDFKKAANWAYAMGIETGELSEKGLFFRGTAPCTRIAAVTYLWLLAGRPESDATSAHQFADVSSGFALYPIAWAVEHGITNGTSATSFSPDKTCTRGHIVAFLYRYSEIS